jgi:uncharacterized protein YjbJ (UPF0337 family)
MSEQYNTTDNTPRKDLGTQGQEDTLKGKAKVAAGKVQSKVGEITNNPDLKTKGDAKQLEGKGQKTLGKSERAVDNAFNPDRPANNP